MANTIEYTLSIKTGTKHGSGTDNNVYITVYGEVDGQEVSTGEINLSNAVRGNAFENNNLHTLHFQWQDLGRPTRIWLRLSNNLLDDWYFSWCKIKRNGTESETVDPDINTEVEFKGDTWFSRKDARMFYANLGTLKEVVVSTKNSSQDGGTEFITLPPGGESVISMAFSETTSNTIEKCVVNQSGQEHTVNVGGEFGFTPGDKGGWGGKVNASYGFSYSTLKSVTETAVNSITKSHSTTATTRVVNDGNSVTEYTDKGGVNEKVISGTDAETRTFAIVYESSIIEVKRKREGAQKITERTDTLNLGRRVRAILPLTLQGNEQVYIDAKGTAHAKNKLWEALNSF